MKNLHTQGGWGQWVEGALEEDVMNERHHPVWFMKNMLAIDVEIRFVTLRAMGVCIGTDAYGKYKRSMNL